MLSQTQESLKSFSWPHFPVKDQEEFCKQVPKSCLKKLKCSDILFDMGEGLSLLKMCNMVKGQSDKLLW